VRSSRTHTSKAAHSVLRWDAARWGRASRTDHHFRCPGAAKLSRRCQSIV